MLDEVPDELINIIAGKIQYAADFVGFSLTSRRHHEICHNPVFLKINIQSNFPDITIPDHINESSLYDFYLNLLARREALHLTPVLAYTSWLGARDNLLSHEPNMSINALKEIFSNIKNNPTHLARWVLYTLRVGSLKDLQYFCDRFKKYLNNQGVLLACAKFGNAEKLNFCLRLPGVDPTRKDCHDNSILYYVERNNQCDTFDKSGLRQQVSVSTPLPTVSTSDSIQSLKNIATLLKSQIERHLNNAPPAQQSQLRMLRFSIIQLMDSLVTVNQETFKAMRNVLQECEMIIHSFATLADSSIINRITHAFRSMPTYIIQLHSLSVQVKGFIENFRTAYSNEVFWQCIIHSHENAEIYPVFIGMHKEWMNTHILARSFNQFRHDGNPINLLTAFQLTYDAEKRGLLQRFLHSHTYISGLLEYNQALEETLILDSLIIKMPNPELDNPLASTLTNRLTP